MENNESAIPIQVSKSRYTSPKTVLVLFCLVASMFLALLSARPHPTSRVHMPAFSRKARSRSGPLTRLLSQDADLVIHALCDTPDHRHLINMPMIQNNQTAVISILAGSSRKSSANDTFLKEIDFLVMFERNGQAVASALYFTRCFLDWRVALTVQCQVVGFGTVPGELTLSLRDNMNKEGRLLCPIESLKIPTSVDLTVRLVDQTHDLNSSVKLCRLDPQRKIHKLVGCSQPLFNVDQLEARWPGLIRMWVLFYVTYLGFGSVSIYDTDGSTEPFIGDLVERGILKYYKNWAPTESMLNLSRSGSTFCSETMMENQCIWQHRGWSEWVMLIHAPDNYLNDVAGAATLLTYLDSIQNRVALTLLTTLVFGRSNVTITKQPHASELFRTITTRECQPILFIRHLPVANPRQVMVLFVHEPIPPFNHIPVTTNECPAQVNHYVTMFRARSIHGTALPDHMFCHDRTLADKIGSNITLLRAAK